MQTDYKVYMSHIFQHFNNDITLHLNVETDSREGKLGAGEKELLVAAAEQHRCASKIRFDAAFLVQLSVSRRHGGKCVFCFGKIVSV